MNCFLFLAYLVAFFAAVLVDLRRCHVHDRFLLVGVHYAFLLGFAAVFLTMNPVLGAIVICITALTLSVCAIR